MTKKSKRDNFTETTRRQLWERAGSRCSNPDCKILTNAPNQDSLDKSVRTGHGAHITAASPDGPRYDKSLTSTQRKHYDNGLWCCYNCGHRIDTEFKTFTVEQLREWKKKAEQSISMGLNKPYYTESEHNDEVQKQIRTLLAPSGASKTLIEETTHNLLQTYAQYFEILDPRLKVKTSFGSNGTKSFEFLSNQNISFNILPTDKYEYEKKLKSFLETGETSTFKINSLTFDSDAINVLIKDLKFEEMTINSLTNKKNFHLSLFFDGITVPTTINMTGTVGTKFIRFEGHLFNSFISIILLISLDKDINEFNIELNFSFIEWDNFNIQELNHFNSVHTFLNKFRKSKFITRLFLTFEEKEIFSSSGSFKTKEFNEIISLVNYTYLAREIATKLNHSIIFDANISFTNNEYHYIYNIYKHTVNYSRTLKDSDIISATLRKGTLDKELMSTKEPQFLEFRGNLFSTIKLFNSVITLPTAKISFSSVTPQIISKRDSDIVKFHPCDKSTMTYSFE